MMISGYLALMPILIGIFSPTMRITLLVSAILGIVLGWWTSVYPHLIVQESILMALTYVVFALIVFGMKRAILNLLYRTSGPPQTPKV
jgi:hypothetical protein